MGAEGQAVEVLVLTQDDCAYCEQASELLERLAGEYPLEVTTRDLDSPEGRELAARGGIFFAPGIFVEGEAFSYGRPSERRLRRELRRRLEAAGRANA
jgi:glutaredoxin